MRPIDEMSIIGLDFGSTIGVAVWPGKLLTHQVLTGTRVEKFDQFVRFFDALLGVTYPDLVVFERPIARGQAATRMLWGMAGLTEALCQHHGLPVLDVGVPEVKKFMTGTGRAGKDEMILAARSCNWRPGNEHEADACGVLLYTIDNLRKQESRK